MKLKLSAAEKMLALSITFTLLLLCARLIRTQERMYIFYIWNLFLAVVPVLFSRRLVTLKKVNGRAVCLIACWLVFFPNAPYIITDIFHFEEREGVPQWYDFILVFSAAWSGLLAGFISLGYIEIFLNMHAAKRWRRFLPCIFLFAASVGIYMGRFLRFNSWDIVTKPGVILHTGYSYTFNPLQHTQAWAFCFACTALLMLIYYSIKNIQKPVMAPVVNSQ